MYTDCKFSVEFDHNMLLDTTPTPSPPVQVTEPNHIMSQYRSQNWWHCNIESIFCPSRSPRAQGSDPEQDPCHRENGPCLLGTQVIDQMKFLEIVLRIIGWSITSRYLYCSGNDIGEELKSVNAFRKCLKNSKTPWNLSKFLEFLEQDSVGLFRDPFTCFFE